MASAESATLTNLAQVVDLGQERARIERPWVELEGITAFATRRTGEMFVVDGSAGVVILHTNALPHRGPGQRLRVTGRVESGLIAPFINAARAEVLGTSPMPEPLRVPLSRLHDGEFPARWVEVTGIVRDVVQEGDFYLVAIRSGGVRTPVLVMGVTERRVPVEWIDRVATIQGISWPEVDREGKHIGTWINVPEPRFVSIGPFSDPSPFQQPALPLGTSPPLRQLSDRRIKVSGTVMFQSPSGRIFLVDPSGAAEAIPLAPIRRPAIWARMPPRPPVPRLEPGDLVELIGAPISTSNAPVLVDAEYRIIGKAPVPDPVQATAEAVVSGSLDGMLVRLRAKLVGRQSRSSARSRVDVLELMQDGRFFEALHETERQDPLPGLPPDSRIELTGICSQKVAGSGSSRKPGIILRGPEDLRVLGPAPWWSDIPSARILGASVGLGAAAVAWIGVLRLQVRRRQRVVSAVRNINSELEQRIHERTTELLGANERLRLHIAEKERAEKVQKALFEISEAAHAAADLPSLYSRLHAIIGTLMRADNFYIALLDEATGMVSFPYHRDLVDAPPPSRKGRRGMTEYVLRHGHPTLADLREIQRLKDAGEYVQSGHPSAIWLGVPLAIEGRTFGVMAVQDQHDSRAFGEDEKRILTFVAGQTALAIWRKRQEEELRASTVRLRESEERFGKAFRSTPAILSIARLSDQRLIEVNEAFLATSGFAPEEVLGRTSRDLDLWVDPDEREAFFARVRDAGIVHSFETRLRTKHGHEEVVLMSAERVDLNGEPCLLALSLVVTARKRAEEELLRSLAQERELNELKSRFVSLVSHEFRTPLGIIMSSAEILENYLERLSEDRRREHLSDIASCTRRMAGLMEEILVLGRAEAGRLECHPAPLDLASFTRRIAEEIQSASHLRCPVRVHIPNTVPEASCDSGLLRHILTNLVENAVKYSPHGRPVDIDLRREANRAVFEVRDQGIGIPESDTRQLFQAFHRGRNVGETPGSGLGLLIVKRCVELHAGHVHFTTREGGGTTFTFSLPVFDDTPVGSLLPPEP